MKNKYCKKKKIGRKCCILRELQIAPFQIPAFLGFCETVVQRRVIYSAIFS